MTRKLPNVLLLTIDALRADRTSLCGYSRPTTPTLERLAQDGVVWDQAVSQGAFTQISFHGFMTSSRPLSYGGYDEGAVGRPKSILRAFGDAGYETVSLATFAWMSRYFGYGDVDRECNLFLLNAIVGIHGSGTMASALRSWHRGDIEVAEAVARTEHLVIKVFDDAADYCARRKEQEPFDQLDLARSRLMTQGFNYDRVLKVVARHRAEYLADKPGYLQRHLTYIPRAHEWIARDWRYKRHPVKLAAEAAFRGSNKLLGVVAPRAAFLRGYGHKRYIDAPDLADRVLREAGSRRNQDRPFFLWTHFTDGHVPYCAGRGRRWYAETARYLSALGYDSDIDPAIAIATKPETEEQWQAWSALYDAVLLYVDEQIGRIVDGLDRLGMRDDTMLVVCGDHGEELGEHGDISHHFRLYDHNIRIPVLFHRPGMGGRRIGGLTTLLDLAPSIASEAGIKAPTDWEGESVDSPSVAGREHVLIETFHGGSCLFDHRPPYFAVRTAKWKFMWKEYLDPTDRFSPDGPELYDLDADPLEQTNLYRDDHPVVPRFNALIAARMKEIPEFANARIEAAFGANAGGPPPRRAVA